MKKRLKIGQRVRVVKIDRLAFYLKEGVIRELCMWTPDNDCCVSIEFDNGIIEPFIKSSVELIMSNEIEPKLLPED